MKYVNRVATGTLRRCPAGLALEAGEAAEVSFRVHADRTARAGQDLQRIVEPGKVDVLVRSAARCRAADRDSAIDSRVPFVC